MFTTRAESVSTPECTSDVETFESIYAEASGDRDRVPWADGRPHPALVTWLNVVAPSIIRCGARVAVVGCGLGEDARELCCRGYEVTAFDCSATAIEWARSLDPPNRHVYHCENLFGPPARWRHRFDLVVEINTIQALPPRSRRGTVGAIAELLAPRGRLLVICRGTDTPIGEADGPPWALTLGELQDATGAAGLQTEQPISVFLDNETPPVKRMRGLFHRTAP